MSEYIDIEPEATDDPAMMRLHTNLALTDAGREAYAAPEDMEEGSPLAQALAGIPGLQALVIDGGELLLTSDGDMPWHIIIADVSAAIKDFFL